MKIAILGTRGIPNNYGGFEQLAEYLAKDLSNKGYDITIYNPTDHPYKYKNIKNIKIKRILSNEKLFSFLNVFIFDFLCLMHASTQKYDIILELGYHPASIFYKFYKKIKPNDRIITNMAGMEWKRSKWGKQTQKFIKFCEKKAVQNSDEIISDNLGIKDYYINTYNKDSHYIAYGAEPFLNPELTYLDNFHLKENNYFLLIARFQKDNNIEIILDGYVNSDRKEPFIVVGSNNNKYGKYLIKKYKNYNIKFVGGIYDYQFLSSLRYYCLLYFHGHSCGGTNPSLLEAMASNTYIASFDNVFNRNVLEKNAVYFFNSKDIINIINNLDLLLKTEFKEKNLIKVKTIYNWKKICLDYESIFKRLLINRSHN